MAVEFNTVDVGRIEVELVTSSKKFRALFIGKIIIHGNHSVIAESAKDVYERHKAGEENSITAVDGTLVGHQDIEQYNIINETAELVTFAYIPKEKSNATSRL